MSENLEALERRTRSVGGIRNIVHTMKTLSAINTPPCEQAAHAITEYLDVVTMGLGGLLQNQSDRFYSSRPSITHRVILALGTDHGLCGNYNELVADRVATETAGTLALKSTSDSQIVCVGAQLQAALHNRHIACQNTLFTASSVEGLTRLAGELVAETDRLTTELDKDTVHVQMIYMQPSKLGQQSVIGDTLLPLKPQPPADGPFYQSHVPFRPWYRQSESSLLAVLLRNYLYASICRAAADALLTENRARLARMRQAEDAVDEQLAGLTQRTRSARQQRITEELQDVVAGFEAVSK